MKNLLLILLFTIATISLNAQKDCDAEFTSGDVLRWRGELKFTPKYMTTEKIDYVINKLSGKAYNQWHIEIAVNCDDVQKKQNIVANMKYFWDNKISETILTTNFPAYYVFYQSDKAAFASSNGNTKTYPSQSSQNDDDSKETQPASQLTDDFLNSFFEKELLHKSYTLVQTTFLKKGCKTIYNDTNNKVLYWTDRNVNVSFTFNDKDECIYYRVLPLTKSLRDRIKDFLDKNFTQLANVKWYNASHSFYTKLILDQEDYFVCYKDLKDIGVS